MHQFACPKCRAVMEATPGDVRRCYQCGQVLIVPVLPRRASNRLWLKIGLGAIALVVICAGFGIAIKMITTGRQALDNQQAPQGLIDERGLSCPCGEFVTALQKTGFKFRWLNSDLHGVRPCIYMTPDTPEYRKYNRDQIHDMMEDWPKTEPGLVCVSKLNSRTEAAEMARPSLGEASNIRGSWNRYLICGDPDFAEEILAALEGKDHIERNGLLKPVSQGRR
jgi:hypothetical protein